MNCDLPIELLSGYLDGELSEQEKTTVEAHLEICPKCREVLSALRTIDENVKEGIFEEPSPNFLFGLNRRVMDKVRAAPRRSLFRFAPVFAPVAAAILIFVVLIEISPSRKIISVDDRVAYQEVAARQEVQMSIPEPELIPAPPAPAAAKRMAKATEDKTLLTKIEQTPQAGLAETRDIDESAVMAPAREQVVRAIIDSTGTIIKVATGNTLTPEKDTILERELAGQQLSPPTIEGKKKQVYFDFATTAENEDDED
jgi:hypothetical protein